MRRNHIHIDWNQLPSMRQCDVVICTITWAVMLSAGGDRVDDPTGRLRVLLHPVATLRHALAGHMRPHHLPRTQ